MATVGVLTRRMPKRSHAVEQARMMLHGSLLTWSFALAAAHLTGFLSSAAASTHIYEHPPSLASSRSPHHHRPPASSDDWPSLNNSNNAWWVLQCGVGNPDWLL